MMPSLFRTGQRRPYAAILLGLFLTACSGDPGTGPIDVHWDRDACERCRMVLSDRHHAAQVRHTDGQGRSQAHLFDDLGCALIWLDDQPWKADPKVEIWVNDRDTGDWLDARSAGYVTGDATPMAYGLGAQPQPGGMDLTAARAHVHETERRYNRPSAEPAAQGTH